jgi:hypothetical protein
MNKIMEALDKRFSGQAAARLDTYAGKMDVLKKGADEATKAIGEGIVGALTALSQDNSIENAAVDMENYGVSIGNAITGVGLLVAELKKIPGSRKVTDVLFGTNIFSMLAKLAEIDQKSKAKDDPAVNTANMRESRLNLKFNKEVVKYNKILADQLKKKTEVDKLSEKFDLERIGLMKALGEATDAETKLRIQAKLAILDNNEALAKKYNAELGAVAAANALATSATTAAGALNFFNGMPALFNSLGELTGRGRNQLAPLEGQSFNYTVPQGVTNQGAMSAATAPIVVNVPVNAGTIVTNQELQGLITDTVRVALKSGNKLLPAGGIS